MATRLLRAWIRATSGTGGEGGAALVEYALLVAMVALTSLAAIHYLGEHQAQQFDSIVSQI